MPFADALVSAGLNVALYWQNKDVRKYVNIVPTSAITGEGLPDMLQLLVKLTQVCAHTCRPSWPRRCSIC